METIDQQFNDDQYVEFKRSRNFSELLNATFTFLKYEYLLFGKTILYFVGPFLLLQAFFTTQYQANLYANMSGDPFDMMSNMFSADYFLIMLFAVAASVMMSAASYSYIQLYVERGANNFTVEDVWEQIKSNLGIVILTTIVVAILVTIGAMLFVIPGIYIGIVFTIVIAMRVFERNELGDALRRAFVLMKGRWWFTVGLLIVIGIVVYAGSAILQIPASIMGISQGINALGGGEPPSTIAIFITTLFSFIGSLLYVIPNITIALHYFNLVEEKDQPGLIDRINDI